MKKIQVKKDDNAVTELIGTMILLVIAVVVISYVYVTVLSNIEPVEEINCDIGGSIESGDVVFTHYGGESLDLDSVVTLSIAGQSESFIVGEYLDSSSQLDGVWNVGEQLVLVNYTNLEDESIILPRVYGAITDAVSKALVFIGTLQDGEIILYRGGLWHFDEGNGSLAYDALGYNSPGVIDGSEWVAGFIGTNIEFNGYTDKVTVKDSYSLDIKDNISIEAWMKPSNNVLLSEIELDADFGYNPRIIHINDTIYAVVYQGKDNSSGNGFLKTFEIDVNGDINESKIDMLEFGDAALGELEPMIIQISVDVYGIIYKNKDEEATLKTVEILQNGTIGDITIDSLILDTNTPNDEPDIIHVSGDIFAAVYRDKTFSKLHTIEIATDGIINGTIDKVTFDSVACEDPEIIHVTGNIFAITYIKSPNQLTVRTVEINSDGTIVQTGSDPVRYHHDELAINSEDDDDPNIIHVTGDIYAVTYSRKNENFGEIATFTIDNSGQISDTIIDVFRFENNKCADPNTIHHGDNIYLIAYTCTTPHTGFVVSIHIQTNGTIRKTISPYYTYAQDQGYEPHIIRINGEVYAIVYRGWNPHAGYLGTINPYEAMDPSNNGIVKLGAYGLYANMTHAFGTINDKTISAKTSGGWIHIILTYDGSYIRLYSNSQELASEPYTGEINRNSNDLYFGVFFNGQIDEIAIYDRVLSPTEILTRYNNQKP